jgi:hypothetical protein
MLAGNTGVRNAGGRAGVQPVIAARRRARKARNQRNGERRVVIRIFSVVDEILSPVLHPAKTLAQNPSIGQGRV